jgi:hypothetical protein
MAGTAGPQRGLQFMKQKRGFCLCRMKAKMRKHALVCAQARLEIMPHCV